MIKLCAKELRTTVPDPKDLKEIKKNPVYIILDNVMDTYNIGSVFRLADAVAAEKVILCGETETPPHTRIKKASINTTEWVAWEYAETAGKAIKDLRIKNKDLKVIAVEQDVRSVSYDKVDYQFPIALIVGHETTGVSREVLDMCDQIVEIPMWGVNKSLNVMVSLGIVLFKVMEKCQRLRTKSKGFV
jgi:23S rRNA (guanosine2251-2'-O)-methyltransferase